MIFEFGVTPEQPGNDFLDSAVASLVEDADEGGPALRIS